MRMDAVLRNLQIVGESIKKLPDEMRSSEPQIPWPSIAAMRNLLVHHYFRIDSDIVLDICKNHLSPLLEALERMSEKYAD